MRDGMGGMMWGMGLWPACRVRAGARHRRTRETSLLSLQGKSTGMAEFPAFEG